MFDVNSIRQYRLQSPFFVYNYSTIKNQYLKLKKNLPANFLIYYSVKANPNINILKIYKNLGANLEVSSGGELSLALKTNFLPKNIIFTGPGKTKNDLELAIKNKIFAIIVESINEIKKIEKISSQLRQQQNILIRLNPKFSMDEHSMFSMAGKGHKFGINEEEIPSIIKYLNKSDNINILGLHLYSGSNIFDEKTILKNTEYLFNYLQKLELKFKIKFPVIDIGGGLAINYSSQSNKKFNIKALVIGWQNLVNKYKFQKKKIIVETGRFLIAESGEYITEVIDIKKSQNEKFIIINGGKNHLSSASILKNNHIIKALNNDSTTEEIVNIVGNLNTSVDFITKTKMVKLKIGDWVTIKKTGAYGLSVGWVLFSGHPLPKEYILLESGELKLI